MGWFLTSNKKKKKKSKRGKSADPKWDPSRTLLGMKFAGFAGAILAVALAWHFGTERLEAYINNQHAAPISAQDIRFSDRPTLMSPADLNQLRAELAGIIGSEPLNGNGLRKAAVQLNSRPDIVRELRQIRRTAEGTVEVDLDFRTPAAVVRMRNERTGELSNDGYHVVDDFGFQMYGPRSWDDLPFDLPVILGVNSKFRPKDNLGEHQWQGQEIAAGLALIKELRKTPAIDFVDSIAVNLTDDRGRIRLVIKTRVVPPQSSEAVTCHIVWGLPPGQERAIEPDVDRKLSALTATLSHDRYRMGHWRKVWINDGNIRPAQAIGSANQ